MTEKRLKALIVRVNHAIDTKIIQEKPYRKWQALAVYHKGLVVLYQKKFGNLIIPL